MCIVFHKWGKWEQYHRRYILRNIFTGTESSPTTERRQRRKCMRCGKEQDEKIKKDCD